MKKNKFNLSHNASLTADMGKLIPFLVLDCVPNDSFNIKMQSFVRAQPMLAPLMHLVKLYTQYWFVPYRILWNGWEDFITGGLSGVEVPTFPTIRLSSSASSLADYFGIPITPEGKTLEVSALPFRAYAEIWNTRYRDEDLQNELPISYSSGVDTITSQELKSCSWAKDYFTTARPFTQRGSQISVPVQTNEVQSSGNFSFQMNFTFSYPSGSYAKVKSITVKPSILKKLYSNTSLSWNIVADFDKTFEDIVVSPPGYPDISLVITPRETYEDYNAGVNITLNISNKLPTSEDVTSSNLTSSSDGSTSLLRGIINVSSTDTVNSLNIRDLRLSSALQRYQERSLEWGNRYEEFIQREFGISPRDSRIQRPEYLGGSSSVLQISEVLQTAEGENTGVGTMRGHAVSGLSQRGIRFKCPEHGVIIGLLSIRPSAVYTQGLNRFWRKFSKLDYFVPELANIGMQEVFASELYADGENYNKIFGYSPRYSEYRSVPNRISGEFRDLLDFWNLSRKFEVEPALNSDFITMNPTKRVFAEQTQNSFLCMLRNDIKAYRPIPKKAKNLLQ